MTRSTILMPLRRLLFAATLLSPLAVLAQSADDPEARAQVLFEQGTKQFDLAEYDEAIASFKEAYRLLEEPLFLYNIGQAYRQKNDCNNARAFYKSYLRKAPDADNRDKVEKRIVEMEECIRARGGDPTVEPPDPVGSGSGDGSGTGTGVGTGDGSGTAVGSGTGTGSSVGSGSAIVEVPVIRDTADDPRPGRTKKLAGMVTGGVGVVLAGTGVYFSMQASDASQKVEAACAEGCSADNVASLDADGKAAQRNATILYAVGGVAVAAGIGVYIWGWLDSKETAQHISVIPTASGGMVVGAWNF